MRSPHTSTTVRLVLLAASLAGMLLVAASPAIAAEGATLGVAPADEPAFFHVELLPGGTTRRTAVVSNHSKTVQQITIYPADGVTTPQGGFSVNTAQQPRTEIGAWTRLPLTALTLPAGGQRLVTFDLAVPVGTPPGDYSGGIVVQSQPRAGQTTQLGHQTAVQLNFVERVAARIYLHVAGTARSSLSLGALTSAVDGSDRTFALTVTNTGNTRLQPSGSLRVEGRPGSPVTVKMSAIDTLLPGQQTILRGRWTHPPRAFWGQATAIVRSEAGTAHARAPLHLVPVVLAAVAIALLLALSLAAVRSVRFLRRARVALRSQPRRPTPLPARLYPAPAGAGVASTQSFGSRGGKGRHQRPRSGAGRA